MNCENTEKYRKRIVTVPNALSLFRLCLIPIIVWLYCFKKSYPATCAVLVLSGLTDIADGIIARGFGMISDLGKALDPVADKLTQIAMLVCLITRFPHMLLPLVVIIIKEITVALTNILLIRKTGEVKGARWHGKVNTALLYSVMILHLIWFNIPAVVSDILVGLCTAMIFLSGTLYIINNVCALIDKSDK